MLSPTCGPVEDIRASWQRRHPELPFELPVCVKLCVLEVLVGADGHGAVAHSELCNRAIALPQARFLVRGTVLPKLPAQSGPTDATHQLYTSDTPATNQSLLRRGATTSEFSVFVSGTTLQSLKPLASFIPRDHICSLLHSFHAKHNQAPRCGAC